MLVATDCLSEGVNLQHHFDAVVHYDLAWNPTRHDQREGRVDRYGQRRDKVRVITLYGDDNGIDGKVLDVLIAQAPADPQGPRHLGLRCPTDVDGRDRRDRGVAADARPARASRAALFDVDAFRVSQARELDSEWNSAAEREKASRSRFAQRSIQPEEVAREVAAIRDSAGRGRGGRGTSSGSRWRALGARPAGAPARRLHRRGRRHPGRPA